MYILKACVGKNLIAGVGVGGLNKNVLVENILKN